MKRIQIIEHNGKPAYAVVPIVLWKRVRENLDNADAVAASNCAIAQDDGCSIPAVMMRAELDRSHPVRARREQLGLALRWNSS